MFLSGQDLTPVQGNKLDGAIVALGQLASSASNSYLLGYLQRVADELSFEWKGHGSREFGLAHKNSDYDLVGILSAEFDQKERAAELVCQSFHKIFDEMPNHTCTFKAKGWCCNGFVFSLRLGGPVIKLDVIFVHSEVMTRPYKSALETFQPLKKHWRAIKQVLPESEKYLAGVVCGNGVTQDFSITKHAIISSTVKFLKPLDRAIYLALKKTFEGAKCPSLVLLALYQSSRFVVARERYDSSAYVAAILAQFRSVGCSIFNDTPVDRTLFFTKRNFPEKTLSNTSILHILTEEQLNFVNQTLDTRVLNSPWYSLSEQDNTWLYTALVASVMKMSPDMYDAHDPQRSMQLFRGERGNSMPDVLVWDLLALKAIKHDQNYLWLEHMLARKLVMNIVQEVPTLFHGRCQSPVEKTIYDLVCIHHVPVGMVVAQINQIIARDHAYLVTSRSMDLFRCALQNTTVEFSALSVDSQPFMPATMSHTVAPVQSPPDGPDK